jgi:hypothetical protein
MSQTLPGARIGAVGFRPADSGSSWDIWLDVDRGMFDAKQ